MRVVVTPEKLATSLLIWLRLAPKRIWRKCEDYERLKAQKRHSAEEAPDPHGELATYLSSRFEESNWEVSRPETKNHG